MTSVSLAGKVTGKEEEPPVTVREFGNGGKIARFSVLDNEYFYVKQTDDRKLQFYTVEVSGKQAEIVAERLARGDQVGVHGQLIQRDWNGKTFLDVKNARITFLTPRPEADVTPGSVADEDSALI